MNNIQGSRELKSLIDEVMQFCELYVNDGRECTGRRFVGIEIDPEIYTTALNRITDEQHPGSMGGHSQL